MGKTGQAGRLDEVGVLVGLPGAFAHWCSEHDVEDLPAFLHALIDGSMPGPSRVWAELQRTLQRARDLRTSGDDEGAVHSLEAFLSRPGFASGDPEALHTRAVALVQQFEFDGAVATPRGELLRAGGLVGARYLADRMSEAEGRPVSVRQVRDRLRHSHGAVRKLGAGYYAAREHPALPVADWVERWLTAHGPQHVDSVIHAILDEYPHGDEAAVSAWLHQEPGHLRLRGQLVESRSRASVA